jgi:membrane-associated phospholipid phosphatase
MPSLHTADALIVGLAVAALARPVALRVVFCLWPVWVSYALIATGNHYWLDVAAGAALGALAVWLTSGRSAARGR